MRLSLPIQRSYDFFNFPLTLTHSSLIRHWYYHLMIFIRRVRFPCTSANLLAISIFFEIIHLTRL